MVRGLMKREYDVACFSLIVALMVIFDTDTFTSRQMKFYIITFIVET